MTHTYVFTDGDAAEQQLGITAQTAGEELARIKQQHGRLEPFAVVNESRPTEAPLHPAFEWRDPVAAEQWREHQASKLIKRVRVVPMERPPVPAVTRLRTEPIVQMPPEPLVDQFDPLAYDLDQAVEALEAARARVTELHRKANVRFDRARVISAGVALNDISSAEELLDDAREALTASRQPSIWHGQPHGLRMAAR